MSVDRCLHNRRVPPCAAANNHLVIQYQPSASYGLQAITDIGFAIEEEAGRGDARATQHWIDELAMYLDRVAPDGG